VYPPHLPACRQTGILSPYWGEGRSPEAPLEATSRSDSGGVRGVRKYHRHARGYLTKKVLKVIL